MVLLVGLDNKGTSFTPAATAPKELDEQLHGLFIGPEVLLGENGISLDDSHKGEVFKVKALARHLGAYQDVGLAPGKIGEHLFGFFLAFGDVCVIAGDGGVRKEFPEFFLYLLGTGPPEFQGLFMTGRAYW